MNICFFAGDITKCGGTERVTSIIANGLSCACDKDSDTFSILSLYESNTEPFFSLLPSIQRYALYNKRIDLKKNYIDCILKLRRFIRRMEIDVIVDVDVMLDAVSIPAITGLETQLVSWEHFNFYESLGSKYRLLVRRLFTKHSDCIVVLTEEDRKYYLSEFGNSCKVEQIYNPIQLDRKVSYSDISKIIISVGRLEEQKGYDYLIDVAEQVLERNPDWEWHILGEGSMREHIESRLKRRQCLRRVVLHGQVSNVSSHLTSAALFVMTSKYEGFPLALLEAKAAKLPVVSFACKTGPSEMIIDGFNGYLIDCFDTTSMAKKIDALINDVNLRKSFSSNATANMNRMTKHYILDQWIRLFSNLTQ